MRQVLADIKDSQNAVVTVANILTNETGNTISFGNTSKWMEVVSITYTATHLSFTVDNNSVIFNNITFVDMQGDLYQYNKEQSLKKILNMGSTK